MQSHEICFTDVFPSFLFVIILNALRFMSFVLLGTHIFIDESLLKLQLPLNLSTMECKNYWKTAQVKTKL